MEHEGSPQRFDWDVTVPDALWAPAKGGLAVLKESWTPDTVILPGLAKSTIDYLDTLKVDLELAAQYACEHA